jgi:hypothetical protein
MAMSQDSHSAGYDEATTPEGFVFFAKMDGSFKALRPLERFSYIIGWPPKKSIPVH